VARTNTSLFAAAPPWSTRANRDYAIGIVRACAGALIFSLPILMTMEMWDLGAGLPPGRIAALLLTIQPVLVGLAYYLGFEDVTRWRDAVLDALVALTVATAIATTMLLMFGALTVEAGLEEWIGKIALQAVPGSIGALLAQSQFGRHENEGDKRRASGDLGEYFFMCAGALFLAANIAPTEEVVLIASMMTPWHSVALGLISLLIMHTFVYVVDFHGRHERPNDMPALRVFVRYSLVGYLLALTISAYFCWTFGHLDGAAAAETIRTTLVLGFPATLGAAAARIVL
jgi:putative integral membrane protein (TIGR02587 family)